MHLAVGFLGHDPEQQRLRQAVALECRRHQVLHVAVVLVTVHQRRAHVGQPAADAGLHRRIELDHAHEALAFIAQQRRRIGASRHVARGQVALVDRILVLAVRIAVVRLRGGLEQALVGGQHLRQFAALLLRAGRDHRLHLGQGRGGDGAIGVLVLGQQGIAIALLGGIHPLLQGRRGGKVTLGLRLRNRRGRGGKQDDGEGGKRGQWANRHQQWATRVGNGRVAAAQAPGQPAAGHGKACRIA
jgi:hypothetical protein